MFPFLLHFFLFLFLLHFHNFTIGQWFSPPLFADFSLSNCAGILGHSDPFSKQCGSLAQAVPVLLDRKKYCPPNQCLVHVNYQAYESECSFLLSPLSLLYKITFKYLMRTYYIIGSGIYIQWFFRAWISTSVTSSPFSSNCQKVLYQIRLGTGEQKKTKSCPHRTHVWFHELFVSFHGFKSSQGFTSASK